MERADVVVVGAGPAGAAAAISIARAGREVVLVDKARFPRDKCCGDGLTTLALRELEALGLRPEVIPSWTLVNAAWLRSPSGRTVELPLPSTHTWHAAIARRSELDAALVDVARHEGAKVLDGHGVTAVDVSDPRVVELTIDGHVGLAANHVIAADGMVVGEIQDELGFALWQAQLGLHPLRTHQHAGAGRGPLHRLYR